MEQMRLQPFLAQVGKGEILENLILSLVVSCRFLPGSFPLALHDYLVLDLDGSGHSYSHREIGPSRNHIDNLFSSILYNLNMLILKTP